MGHTGTGPYGTSNDGGQHSNHIAEVTIHLVKDELQNWIDKQGHNKCWYYPEIFRRLCDLLNVKPSVAPYIPTEDEFIPECKRYYQEEVHGSGQMS
jgi:hypothetical protein